MCLTWLYQYLGEIKNDFGNAKQFFSNFVRYYFLIFVLKNMHPIRNLKHSLYITSIEVNSTKSHPSFQIQKYWLKWQALTESRDLKRLPYKSSQNIYILTCFFKRNYLAWTEIIMTHDSMQAYVNTVNCSLN